MRLWFGFVSTPGAESVRCAVQNSTRPNPTNIANANPNPPTPAGRVVPVHSWRLVIVPCGLILCAASLVRFCLNASSRVCALCVFVCVFFPSILDINGRTSRGHTGGRSHRIFNPPSFCGACLDFCREKDSAIPFPRRREVEFCVLTN